MATMDDSTDGLWNESVCSKSWADLVDEEESITSTNISHNNTWLKDLSNLEGKSSKKPVEDENACDITLSKSRKIEVPKSDVLPNFSVSHTIKETIKSDTGKNCEPVKEFLQEDLSLTSHLNGFQLVSPCKPVLRTPTKNGSSDVKMTKRKLESDVGKCGGLMSVADEVLMPSPSKMRKQQSTPTTTRSTPTKRQTPMEKYCRKRTREITPAKSSEKKNPPREVETDPEVLARRQKQIDYGKNTIGYERYRQLVPKEGRAKMHPRTPPLHLKFSRRAWDGLIKVWRQRLHFWDPPSEGGGNPASLEITSDYSDASSTDGSLPNTPVQDKKRARSRRPEARLSLDKSQFEQLAPKLGPQNLAPASEEEDDGCAPLSPVPTPSH